jgi:hypothetical protein
MVRKVQNVGLIVFTGNLRFYHGTEERGRKKATTPETVESKCTVTKTKNKVAKFSRISLPSYWSTFKTLRR